MTKNNPALSNPDGSEKNPENSDTFIVAFPGKYIQAEGAIHQLPDLVKLLGKKALILASKSVKKNILPDYNFFNDNQTFEIEEFQGECCETELQRIETIIKSIGFDVIIAMGGGKTIDTGKIVADRTNLPVIITPTIASSDAPCSGCAVIYTDDGIFESVYVQKMNPDVVLVDLNFIAKAPVRYLIAGIGDALATWFEAKSCQRTKSQNECGGSATMTAMMIAKLCYETLLKYSNAAVLACANNLVSPALNRIVEANTLLSGIGFESAGLAAAHSIHNGLTAINETSKYLHGEKVAFGVLTGLMLNDAKRQEIDEVYDFCMNIGLPTTLEEIGIENPTDDILMKIAEKATQPAETIHKEAGIITPRKVVNAIKEADLFGKKLKGLS